MLTPNTSFVSIHVEDELNRNNINLLESNHQHTVQYFAVDEENWALQISSLHKRRRTNDVDVTQCINILLEYILLVNE